MVNEESEEKFVRAAERKGVGYEGERHWLVKDADGELKVWGHPSGIGSKLIWKRDGDKLIASFLEALATFHGGVVIPEMPAKGEFQSNGVAQGGRWIVREIGTD